MFTSDEHWGFDWGEFILGILFIIAACGVLRYPGVGLTVLAILFGIMAIIAGITSFSAFSKLRKVSGGRSWFALFLGIVDVLLGIWVLVDINLGIAVLGYLFAIWFIIDAIERLIVVDHLSAFGSGWMWLSVILDIIMLILGLYLIFVPVVSIAALAMFVVIYLFIAGFNAIFIAFAHGNK
ncbi:HdeD family acid-resistance protein [Levilactobacillus bambusae]|uniref:HdeD family acid-resistance protein n=1 Tax=Levilactobacillus bambusae TaxID=2024736 RepID=A0A2V1MWL5_9LACO|nr:DUF308 domain-containing protein [Levilactobacillus bambusae]PWF99438.1 hypothetical protein DCM90_08275 [Levilactobacillus bambusae]